MNAARRARQKANRENAHTHLNRAARTDEDGAVMRCLFCRPVAGRNETTQQHAGMIFRPVTGTLKWGKHARGHSG